MLFLANGFGCDQNLWSVVERLKADFRILLMDHVGSGASDPTVRGADKYSFLTGYADRLRFSFNAIAARLAGRRGDAAVDGDDRPGEVGARPAGEKDGNACHVVVAPDSA